MRMTRRLSRLRARALLLLLVLLVGSPGAYAAECDAADFELRVSGTQQCLVMRRFGTTQPDVMVVWLHGDVSSGGPADYHFAIAERAAREFADAKVLSVALVRPGYPDDRGNSSTVAFLQSGRADHYTKENVGEVGAAIGRLRDRFKPRKLIVVGHSGGAATAAILLGMKPGFADAAVLVACPCDLVAWRAGRRAWSRSENPIDWADRVDASTRVIALTGTRDDNTAPALAQAYVHKLRARHVDATFEALPGETHNGAFRAPEVFNALRTLLQQSPH